MISALVVAGGAGERMRRSGSQVPKPLVEVRGVTLLERNVRALLRAGVKDVHVAVASGASDVIEHASRCAELATRHGASLQLVVEERPLGSMGAAALVDTPDHLLVVNADNLTVLDLRALVDDHRRSGAAMTIAVHDEPFPMPFGEVSLDGDRVVAYREKPTYRITICTAVSVLGPEALALVHRGEDVGLPALCNRVLEAGLELHAHRHEAPWVDVNDLGMLDRAERLVDEHGAFFGEVRS